MARLMQQHVLLGEQQAHAPHGVDSAVGLHC